MLNQRYIIEDAHAIEGGNDLVAEARAKYKETYPSRVARRMTHIGMMTGLCLKPLSYDQNTPIVYASVFGESQSLEAFIDSFPGASPLHFQRSIHPSAIEQTLIANKQPINRFYPITSDFNLAGQAIESPLISDSDRSILVGGDERATWLCEHELASHTSFACSLLVKKTGEGIGSITIGDELPENCESECTLSQLARAIQEHSALQIPSYSFNRWIHVSWE